MGAEEKPLVQECFEHGDAHLGLQLKDSQARFSRTLERMHILPFCELAVVGSFALATSLFLDFAFYDRLAPVSLWRVTLLRTVRSRPRS